MQAETGKFAASSTPTMTMIRREIRAHGSDALVGCAMTRVQREIRAHGLDALADTEAVEPRDPGFAGTIAQPKSMNDNCCGILTLVNLLDSKRERLAFCGGNLERPEAAFLEYMERTEPDHDGKEYGYTHLQMQGYLQHLVDNGTIKGWVFRRLKQYSVLDLLGPRGQDKRMRDGDNLVVFGRASKSDGARKVKELVNKNQRQAKKKGASVEEIADIALQTYYTSSSVPERCNKKDNPEHAVGVRYRREETEEGERMVAELVDPAKQVVKELSVQNYSDCMAELREVWEAGKKQMAAHYYVFRLMF